MSNFIDYARVFRGCLTGEYPATNHKDVKRATCIIAQSFGTREKDSSTPYGKINQQLAHCAAVLSSQLEIPLIAQEEVADALSGFGVAMRISGDPSSTSGEGLDSWSVLRQAQNNQEGIDTDKPLIVAQAHHVARVALQASLLEMTPSLPARLPREFAPNSTQFWTRSRGLWVAREFPGIAVLKLQGKL